MNRATTIQDRSRAFAAAFVLIALFVVSGAFTLSHGSHVVTAAAVTTSGPDSVGTRSVGSGEASYYGARFAGRPTANGETFDPSKLTAAHRTLPFGSRVRVTNTANGRSVVVRVNDRGPFVGDRVIDVSQGAAEQLGMIHSGTAQVRLEILS